MLAQIGMCFTKVGKCRSSLGPVGSRSSVSTIVGQLFASFSRTSELAASGKGNIFGARGDQLFGSFGVMP